VLARILAAVAAVVIFVIAMGPPPAGPSIPFLDKLEHLAAFATLGFLTLFALGGQGLRPLVTAVLLCVGWGIAIELAQPLVGRSRELADVGADLVGAALGAVAAVAARRLVHLVRARRRPTTRPR
jgi:VanZ family protein